MIISRLTVKNLISILIAWGVISILLANRYLYVDKVEESRYVHYDPIIITNADTNADTNAIIPNTNADTNNDLPSCIKQNKFCRYDDIGEFIEVGSAKGIIHEPLPSIPSHRRIPHDKANDWPYILNQRAILPDDGSMTALMDYNAILLPLYKNTDSGALISDLDPIILDQITGKYHPYFTKDDVDKVKYLSISRASNLHSCKPKFKFYFGTIPQDYLGLSLLDEHLNRIKGTDIAINVDKWLLGNMTSIFYDFQIIAARTTKHNLKKDQLFLFPSGAIGTFGMLIDIRRVPPPLSATSTTKTRLTKKWHTKSSSASIPFKEEYAYGHGLEVRITADRERLLRVKKNHVKGDVFFNYAGIHRGKNFHFFESTNGDTFMELWPHGSHRTAPINFFFNRTANTTTTTTTSKIKGKAEGNDGYNIKPTFDIFTLFPNQTIDRTKKGRFEVVFNTEIQSKQEEPKWSFPTDTPNHSQPYKRFRGTSQIIDMVLNGTNVKVGISHSLTGGIANVTDNRAYLSQFYAFSPDPPFNIIAITGHFCWRHMTDNDIGYSAQWISKRDTLNRTAPILIKGEEYRCPIISFASGMTEMIGHGGKNVIITYGVNDCYSRSIVIPKKRIEMLLLGQSLN